MRERKILLFISLMLATAVFSFGASLVAGQENPVYMKRQKAWERVEQATQERAKQDSAFKKYLDSVTAPIVVPEGNQTGQEGAHSPNGAAPNQQTSEKGG